jgi:CheY-like chemotaxis protein
METEHILVIDSDQVSRVIAKRSLKSRYVVTTLSSAREAIAFVSCHSPSLILINVTLVMSMDCVRLFREIIKVRPDLNFRAYATTSHIDEKRIRVLKAVGFDGVLHKPLTLEKIEDLNSRVKLKNSLSVGYGQQISEKYRH